MSEIFKKCPMCSHVWHNRIELLNDPDVKLIGYQAHFVQLELGLFLFNHLICRGTFALQARNFTDLYKGKIFTTRLTGLKDCPGYCLKFNNMQMCPQVCECAYIRKIIQIINNWHCIHAVIECI
jgi:hypothetical protein